MRPSIRAAAVAAAVLVSTALPIASFADAVQDADTVGDLQPVSFTDLCPGDDPTTTVAVGVRRNGNVNNSFQGGQTLAPSSSTTGGVDSTVPGSVTLPSDWLTHTSGEQFLAAAATFPVVSLTDVAASGSGTVTYKFSGKKASDGSDFSVSGTVNVSWTVLDADDPQCATGPADDDNDGVPNDHDNCPDNANADQADVDGDDVGDACDDNSYAPEVGMPAADANGEEGDTLATGGSFTDQDNNPLTITVPDGTPGSFQDLGNGAWSWSLPTNDDVPAGSITVTASDGEKTATDTFEYGAVNVAPLLAPVGVTYDAACSVSISASFTDKGSADTHSSVIDWGDGETTTDNSEVSPVTGSHTFNSAGTFDVLVTVTDDDGGQDSGSAQVGTKNTASGIMQPINLGAQRSAFKIGSTIPVKITVTDCDGNLVTDLTPTVKLIKIDSNPDGSTLETPVDAPATNGLDMRWDVDKYIYNLSTKKNQQTGGALTAGTYRVEVHDPSFFAPSTALFDMKK